MNTIVLVAVLSAAVLHASWNAMLKSGADRFWWITAFCVFQGCIAAIVLFFVGLPAPASWPYVTASALIHVVYQLLLGRTYATGDFGQTYPIARGSSPVLVAVGALVFAHEALSVEKVAGIVLVSGGILALAFEGRRIQLDRVPTALATGVSIAAYTVVDGLGARIAGSALSFIAAMTTIWAVCMVAVFVARRGLAMPHFDRREMTNAIVGGAIAQVGYTVVIWAMTVTPMGLVSALRETSVVFAAIIARLFLKERLSPTRLGACVVIAGGAALLA